MEMKKLIPIFLFISVSAKVFSFSNDTLYYPCNYRLIHSHPVCDSLRDKTRDSARYNYRKMLKKDDGIIRFLNSYRNDEQSTSELAKAVDRIGFVAERLHISGDTTTRQVIIRGRGLLKLLIRYQYLNNVIINKYYDLEINNPDIAKWTQPLTYHYLVFQKLEFCLGRRFSCYHFEDTF